MKRVERDRRGRERKKRENDLWFERGEWGKVLSIKLIYNIIINIKI